MKKLLFPFLIALVVCLSPQTANADQDNQAPSVFLSYVSPAADQIGDEVLVGVVTSDANGIAKVEFLIDGAVVATSTSSPWDRQLNMREVSEGRHQLQVRSYDPTGNNGISAPLEITVDHTAPVVNFDGAAGATNAARPEFTFSTPSTDLDRAGCVFERPGEGRDYFDCAPGQPFTADIGEEGDWDLMVYATDLAGNRSVSSHRFIIDRTTPEAEFTSGPPEGAELEPGAEASFAWASSDDLSLEQSCSWDGDEAEACESSAAKVLTAGRHSFEVTVTDAAGNRTAITRTFVVKASPPVGPGADTTAPVVKLNSPKQKLEALRKGLKVRVSCSEACSGKVVAKATGPARSTKGVEFTARVELAAAGTATVRLRPTAKAGKKLRKLTKPLKLTVRTDLADPSGNSTRSVLKTRAFR